MQSWLGGPYVYDPKCDCPMCTARRDSPSMERPMILFECCARTLERDGAYCVFGCNSVVDEDTRMCPTCRDHSAPMFECDTCARHWEKWGDEWEAEAPTVVTDDHADDWRPGRW